MALARVLVNCRAFRVSFAAALAAFWLWSVLASACRPAAAVAAHLGQLKSVFLLCRFPGHGG
jgi:hypothetical protein